MFTPTTTSATNSWMRWSRSAPNLPKTLSCMGDQSVIRAFTDLGLFLSCFHFKIHFSSVIYNVHSYDTSSACMVAVLSSLPVHPRGTAFHIQSASWMLEAVKVIVTAPLNPNQSAALECGLHFLEATFQCCWRPSCLLSTFSASKSITALYKFCIIITISALSILGGSRWCGTEVYIDLTIIRMQSNLAPVIGLMEQ